MSSDKNKLFTFRPGEKILEMLDQAKVALGLKSSTDVAREAIERGLERLMDENVTQRDRQDYVDLEKDPRRTLLSLAQKAQAGDALSRPEWHFLASAVNQAYATAFHRIEVIDRDLLVANLQAFASVIALRNQQYPELASGERDGYYFGNMGFSFVDRDKTKNDLQAHVAAVIAGLPKQPSVGSGSFPSRNLDVALRDERPLEIGKLNATLRPYLHALLLVALRGYWYKNEKPILTQEDWRDKRRNEGDGRYLSSYINFPSVSNAHFSFMSLAEQTTISGAIDVLQRRFVFALNHYIELTDFFALLHRVGPGMETHASIAGFQLDCYDYSEKKNDPNYIIATGRWRHFFSQQEFDSLKQLLHDFLAAPEVQEHLKKLELIYGRI